jgi:hypothetical protein
MIKTSSKWLGLAGRFPLPGLEVLALCREAVRLNGLERPDCRWRLDSAWRD